MTLNFMEAVKEYFGADMMSKAASYLGEPESTLKKTLDAIIPVSLAGIVRKAETSPETLLDLAKDSYKSGIVNNLADSFRTGGQGVPISGPSLISNIFGDRFGAIANAVSSHTGSKGATSSSLFGTIVPLALGLIGKYAGEHRFTPAALASALGSQKHAIMSLLPAGLTIPGLSSFSSGLATPGQNGIRKPNWVLPILIAVAGLVLLWWFLRPASKPQAAVAYADTAASVKVTNEEVDNRLVKLTLVNGTKLEGYKGGIEDRLLAFINDENAVVGKDIWFDFRELNFKFGTAEIIPESRKEIDNIVKILQAYPRVKIKLGGYTDKVGDEDANRKLSAARASAVADALKAAGVSGQVTGAEGYGSAFAQYPADAPESDRIKDRHVSISVREK